MLSYCRNNPIKMYGMDLTAKFAACKNIFIGYCHVKCTYNLDTYILKCDNVQH